MLIKSKNKNQLKERNFSKYFKLLKNKSSKILFLVFYSIILISVTSGFGQEYLKFLIRRLGLVEIKDDIKEKLLFISKPDNLINTPKNWIMALPREIDNFYIDMKYENLNKLNNKRKEALKKGVLISKDSDFVNAKITFGQNQYKASIRLKGDLTDHLEHPKKWSFRIKLKNKEVIYGINKFSLQTPHTRNYIWEKVFHLLLKEKDLPSLKYKYVNLFVNGDNLGTYALEQHFDKILIESNKNKEGPIIALSEDFLWENIESQSENGNLIYDENQAFFSSPIKVFKKNKIYSDPFLGAAYLKASKNIREFQKGNLKTSEVFDVNKLSKFFAITDLVNSWHSSRWHNQRFYYDPYSMFLIPIGFDSMSGGINGNEKLKELSIERFSDEEKRQELPFFEDLIFVESYLKELDRLISEPFIENFLLENKKIINTDLAKIHKSYPHQKDFSHITRALKTNKLIIYDNLYPKFGLVDSFITNSDTFKVLNIGNMYHLPLEIIGIKYKGTFLKEFQDQKIIPAKSKKSFINYKKIKLNNDINFTNKNEIILVYKILGLSKIYNSPISFINNNSLNNSLVNNKNINKNNQNIYKNENLKFTPNSREINFNKQRVIIEKPLIIPKGYVLKVYPGQELIFKETGYLFSNSPIYFSGTNKKPIKIFGKSKGNSINIIDAEFKSNFSNVEFNNLSTDLSNKLPYSGGINIYNSDIEISDCIFNSNYSEDNINIVKSNFLILNSTFFESYSDAIDIDFSNGSLKNILVKNSGNDGIDFSGSEIIMDNINIINSNDKAISIGESSRVSSKNINLKRNFIGIAVKDGSSFFGNKINSIDNKYNIVLFKKKKEYSYPLANMDNYKSNANIKSYLIGNGSYLKINNKIYNPNEKDETIFKLIYE